MNLPLPLEVALHNELHSRGILTYEMARASRAEVKAALHAVFKVDVSRIIDLFAVDGAML